MWLTLISAAGAPANIETHVYNVYWSEVLVDLPRQGNEATRQTAPDPCANFRGHLSVAERIAPWNYPSSSSLRTSSAVSGRAPSGT